MMKEGGFEPIENIENKEEVSGAGKPKKISRFRKMAQVLGLATGMAIGANEAGAQSESTAEESAAEFSANSGQTTEFPKESERYWENLLDAGNASSLIVHFREYANYSFAQSLLERAVDTEPRDALYFADTYLSAPYGEKILRTAVQNLLSGEKYSKELVAGDILNNVEKIGKLKDSETLIKGAVEACMPFQILKFSEIIFKYLPRSVAESFLEKAARQTEEEDPDRLLDFTSELTKFLPGGKDFLGKVIDELLEEGSSTILYTWNLEKIKEVFGEDKVQSIMDGMLHLNPAEVLDKLEFSVNSANIYEALEKNSSPEARIILEIYQSEHDSDTKKRMALILDQLVYDKHLSVEDAAELVKDDKKYKELLEEIKKRPRYIGSAGIAEEERRGELPDQHADPDSGF